MWGGGGGPFWNQSEAEKGRVLDTAVVARVWSYLAPFKLQVLWAFLLVVVYSGMQILGPYLLKVAIDEYLVYTQDMVGLTIVSMAFLLTLVVSFGSQAYQSYVMASVAQSVLSKMRGDLFRKINYLSLGFHDRHESGVTMSRIINDVAVFQELLTQGVVHLIADCIVLIGTIIVMVSMSPKLALYAFSVLPVMVAATIIFSIYSRKALDRKSTRLNSSHRL